MRTVLASLTLFLVVSGGALASDQDRIEAMLGATAVPYERSESDTFKILISFDDGRSQLVFLQLLDPVREEVILELYSPVMRLSGEVVPAALGTRLLQASGSQKLGYYGVEEVDGTWTVFCYHNLPLSNLGATTLASVIKLVAEIADEMEKEQLGVASDEF